MNEPYILITLIIALAFFGESMFGFGGGLIAIPLLSIFMGVSDAVTLVLISQFCMGLLIFKVHKQVNMPAVLPIAGTLVLGTILGTVVLSMLNPDYLRLILAALIVTFLIKTYFFTSWEIGKKHRLVAGNLAGLVGGLFQGLTGTGGPVLTMYLSTVIKQKAELRASLIALFFITSIVRVGTSIPQGLFTPQLLKTAAIVLPFFLIAIAVGQRVQHKLSENFYRHMISALLFVSAVTLVIKAV
jgi:uncharacterized protein